MKDEADTPMDPNTLHRTMTALPLMTPVPFGLGRDISAVAVVWMTTA